MNARHVKSLTTTVLAAAMIVAVPSAASALATPAATSTPAASDAGTGATAPACTAPVAVTTDPATLKGANVGATILAPTPSLAGATVKTGTVVTVTANGWAAHGLHDVSFYANSCLIATDTTYPYSVTWNATALAGQKVTLMAEARDVNGVRVRSTTVSAQPVAPATAVVVASPSPTPTTPAATPTPTPTASAATPTPTPTTPAATPTPTPTPTTPAATPTPTPTTPAATPTTPAATPTPTSTASATPGSNLDSYGDLAAPLGGYFGASSVWNTDISQAPLATDSAAMASNLEAQVQNYYGGTAAFNAYNYNESMVTAPAGTPTTTVIFDDCQHKGYTPAGLYGNGGQFVNVPIPANAVPASGTDGGLAIYSPDTNQLWSFWQAKHQSDGWHACWGGRIDDVSDAAGYFTNGFGASASGLSSEGGAITIRDIESGSINHAMSLAIVNPAPYTSFVWPAQRSDGSPSSTSNIPDGTRFRLDPSINVSAVAGMSKIGRMIARAAQKYGFIVTDQAGAVSVVTESGNTVKATIGSNPWDSLLGATPTYAVMNNFPWANIQAIQAGWGQPITTPVITSVWPTSGPAAGGTKITIQGQNLLGITAAAVGGYAAASVTCATSFTCTVITAAGSGAHGVYLTNSAGTNPYATSSSFTYK